MLELPVELAVLSIGLANIIFLYSTMTAADRTLDWLIVIEFPALETFGAYQISVVEPLAFVAWAALVQVAPVCEMPVTIPAAEPLVAIIATRVFPLTGAEDKVTENDVAVFTPVFPVVDCTRVIGF